MAQGEALGEGKDDLAENLHRFEMPQMEMRLRLHEYGIHVGDNKTSEISCMLGNMRKKVNELTALQPSYGDGRAIVASEFFAIGTSVPFNRSIKLRLLCRLHPLNQ
jgi:hypothetical protein